MKQTSRIKLQERDYEIMRYLNVMGFSTIEILMPTFFSSKQRCYARMLQLVNSGLVDKSKESWNGSAFYKLSSVGNDLIYQYYMGNGVIQSVARLPTAELSHQIMVSKIRVVMEKKHNIKSWKSERELKSLLGQTQKKLTRDFVPDGYFVGESGARYSLEMEICQKSKKRLIGKVYHHLDHFDADLFDKTLFVTTSESVFRTLTEITEVHENKFDIQMWDYFDESFDSFDGSCKVTK